MSLRLRLTILYTSIVAGILLLLGMAVNISVSTLLTDLLDANLEEAANQALQGVRTQSGQVDVGDLDRPDLPVDVMIQYWNREPRLVATSMNVGNLRTPLDSVGLTSSRPVYRDVNIGRTSLRVLTVPLVIGEEARPVGTLQVGTSLSVVHTTQRLLLVVLLTGMVISVIVAGLIGWVSIQRALSPLGAVTQTALQITRADDLSRRIPYNGPAGDEIGQLITAFNQTLGRLETLFNSQRRFVADVGHELRTPLTVIKGNVGLMRRINCVDEESLDSIDGEVDRLTRLVGDLLLLAQAESGKMPLIRKVVEVDTLLLDVMQQMSVLARDRLQMRLGEIDQVLVCGDQDRLKQVLVNLIGNAIQYTPLGGEVLIGLGKQGDRARITISDTGPGIPAEDMPHIFERFYRAEKSRTRRDGKGFGLGLSIAYWIVRNHGGQIDVASREPHGTTFTVWLPLATSECVDELAG